MLAAHCVWHSEWTENETKLYKQLNIWKYMLNQWNMYATKAVVGKIIIYMAPEVVKVYIISNFNVQAI